MEEKLKKILSLYKGNSNELIPILQHVQKVYSYLPEHALLEISKFISIPKSQIYAVASFYSQFRFTPMGKNKVMVCRGTACHVRGASRILDEVERQLDIKEGETTKDLEYTLETVACIGCCALAPCITINEDVYGQLTRPKTAKLFQASTKEERNNDK